jgi:DNA-binding LytR/AlgR family response regulator
VREALAARWTARVGSEVEALLRQARGAAGAGGTHGAAGAAEGQVPLADRIPVTVGKRTVLVRVADIRWVEADGNYARLHTASRSYLLRTSLTALEERLPRDRFARIHRSTIVRLETVLELRALGNGDYEVVLDDGTTLTMGQTYRARLLT